MKKISLLVAVLTLTANIAWATCPAVSNSGADGFTIKKVKFASLYSNGTNMIIRGQIDTFDNVDVMFSQNNAPIEVIMSCLQNARSQMMLPPSPTNTAYNVWGWADVDLVIYGSITTQGNACTYRITDPNGLQCTLHKP